MLSRRIETTQNMLDQARNSVRAVIAKAALDFDAQFAKELD